MTAADTDLLRLATPNFETTLNGSISPSDTDIVLQSVGDLPTSTAVTLVIDATDSDGNPTPAVKEVITGVVDAVNNKIVTSLRGLDDTTAQSHATGAVVTMWITANLWNDLLAAILAQHNQAGAHTAVTAQSIVNAGNYNQTSGTFHVPDGVIQFAHLAASIFGAQVQSYANTGAGGVPQCCTLVADQ